MTINANSVPGGDDSLRDDLNSFTDNAGGNPLLLFGILPFFIFNLIVIFQSATRDGFNLVKIPLSLLAVGEDGWIQTVNFIGTGLLIVGAAIGVYLALSRSIARILILISLVAYGSGMIVAGIFPSDPLDNFPLGARQPEVMSETAGLHGLGFLLSHIGLLVACCACAWMFFKAKDTKWAGLSAFTAILAPVIVAAAFSHPPTMGIAFFSAGVLGFGWLALVCWRLRRHV